MLVMVLWWWIRQIVGRLSSVKVDWGWTMSAQLMNCLTLSRWRVALHQLWIADHAKFYRLILMSQSLKWENHDASHYRFDCSIPTHHHHLSRQQSCQGRQNRARVADPRSCDKFFECFFGRTVERSCSPGQLFDSLLESCIHASAARCGSRPTQSHNMPTNVDMWLSMNVSFIISLR